MGTLAILASCRAKFDGPYACAPGYASCTSGTNDQCETNVATDGLHCGACGRACPVGAVCSAGTCGPAATMLAQLATGSQTAIAVNATAVFWETSSGIQRVASSGGPTTTIASDAATCSSSTSFAVDDENLYYWTNNISQTGGAGLVKHSLTDGSTTVLFTAATANGPCPLVAVDATHVYVASIAQSGSQTTVSVRQIPIAGGAPTTLGTFQSSGGTLSGMAVSARDVIFGGFSDSGPASLRLVPIAGGPVSALSVGNAYFNFFTADAANAYVVGSGCPCSGNSNGGAYVGLPMGTVTRIPLDGHPATVLAAFSGIVEGVAVDPQNVYWTTDTTLWKVPLAGGDPTPIAGNLSSGAAPSQCNGCSGGGSTPTSPVAARGSNVYVAASSAGAILEVSR